MNTKYFAKYFETLLNGYGLNYGKTFKVFADEGEMKKELKRYGQQPITYTNAVCEIIGTTLQPIRDIRLNTYTVQLKLFVDLDLNGRVDNESVNLDEIRSIVAEIIQAKNGATEIETIEGVSFSKSMTVEYPTDGVKTELGHINECLVLYWTWNFALFEDGVNANDCSLIVNGTNCPFTRLVLTRKRTAESSTPKKGKGTKSIMQAHSLSLDAVMPALKNNDFSNLIMRDVIQGGNYALNVKLNTPNVNANFIGTFGDTTASLDIATNIGYNFAIVEGFENTLDYSYSENWAVQDLQGSSLTLENDATVYWGDGTVEELEAGTHEHNYTDGKTTHKIRIYWG